VSGVRQTASGPYERSSIPSRPVPAGGQHRLYRL